MLAHRARLTKKEIYLAEQLLVKIDAPFWEILEQIAKPWFWSRRMISFTIARDFRPTNRRRCSK